MIKSDILQHLICYEVKFQVLKHPFPTFISGFKIILDKIVENSHLQEFVAQTVFFCVLRYQLFKLSTWMNFGQNSTWKEDFWVKVATYI
jgi:hypothetical protein